MKIEIGESILYSYLRHVKACMIVQNNWKTSNSWDVMGKNADEIKYIYDKINKHSELGDIFKTELNQTIKQAEIDVIGMDSGKTLYMAEVAFHENGLQYGTKIETKNRVVKKILKAYLTAMYFFPDFNYEIIFSSPKVNPATDKVIKDYFEVVAKEFNSEKVIFKYIANEDFKNEIMKPTIKAISNEADTSELFARSYKLIELFNMTKKEEEETEFNYDYSLDAHGEDIDNTNQVVIDATETKEQINLENSSYNIKIKGIEINLTKMPKETTQDFVKRTLKILLINNLIPEKEIRNLMDKDYCKDYLGLQFPLFQIDKNKCIDNTGHSRYWQQKIMNFYVCSQWWKQQESLYAKKLSSWLLRVKEMNK